MQKAMQCGCCLTLALFSESGLLCVKCYCRVQALPYTVIKGFCCLETAPSIIGNF